MVKTCFFFLGVFCHYEHNICHYEYGVGTGSFLPIKRGLCPAEVPRLLLETTFFWKAAHSPWFRTPNLYPSTKAPSSLVFGRKFTSLSPHFCHYEPVQREFHPYRGWRKVFSSIFCHYNPKGSFTLIKVEGRSFPPFLPLWTQGQREFHPYPGWRKVFSPIFAIIFAI